MENGKSSGAGRAVAGLLLAGALTGWAGTAQAGEADGCVAEAGGDRAAVAISGGTEAWWTAQAQLTCRRAQRGGLLVRVEALRRLGDEDLTFSAGVWRHFGPWTVRAEAGATPHADFHYRAAIEGEVFRALAGGLVAQTSYRYLAFPTAGVDLVSPGLTWYSRGGEVQLRAYFGRNRARGSRSRAVLARASWEVGPRLTVGGGLAVGQRLFDVTALSGDPAAGWVAFAESRLALTATVGAGLTLRVAHEDPSFEQTAVGLSLRWRP